MDEGLEEKINATVKFELSEYHTELEIAEYIKLFHSNSGTIPANIKRGKNCGEL